MEEIGLGFVKTQHELAAFARRLRSSTSLREGLEIPFATTEEFVKEVLPPCFAPSDRGPVGTIRCNKLIGNHEPFDAASVNLYAKYSDIEGMFQLFLLISGDMTVTFGRELWGEVKKGGTSALIFEGTRVRATATRHGIDVIEIQADLLQDMDVPLNMPLSTLDQTLHVKAFLDPSGRRLQYDPIVVIGTRRGTTVAARKGPGQVVLRSNGVDVLDQLPIVSTGEVTYSVGTGEVVGERRQFRVLGDDSRLTRDSFVPYVVGLAYDWPEHEVSLSPRAPFLTEGQKMLLLETFEKSL